MKWLFKKIKLSILKIFGLDITLIYNEKFAISELRNKKWVTSFAYLIVNKFKPKSIIDFGCGTGDILKPFEDMGITIQGIDGSKANYKHRKILEKNFITLDLRKPYSSSRIYDICLCLEVAEHIEEDYVEILISSLTKASKTIIFTAAAPNQLGVNHLTLKPKKWWINKFIKHNFYLDKKTTKDVKSKLSKINEIQKWYINNLLIFKSRKHTNKR